MRFILIILIIFSCPCVQGQAEDSTRFPSHEVISVIRKKPFFTASAEQTISREHLEQQYPYSPLSAVNTVPGVRMEERSPGSYRLSIRGSLLRSPFGVRNVKIYLGPFPFTDAGGNTYLNSLDISFINSITILKGPQSGTYGANTGGVVLIDPVPPDTDSTKLIVSAGGGSFNLFQESIFAKQRFKKSTLSISQAYLRSNGYRVHSGMNRLYTQASYKWDYHPRASFQSLALYSDLYYQTPGGLAKAQHDADPRQARPATPVLPGAAQQNASVYNRTVFAGISHAYKIRPRVYHVVSVFASGTRFENPFITNYEQRLENNYGVRTSLDYAKKNNNLTHQFNLGAELQQGSFSIDNHGNRLGKRDTLQAADKLRARQGFIFLNFVQSGYRHQFTGSLSYNFFGYTYRNVYPFPAPSRKKTFSPKLMPNLSMSYQIIRNRLSLWATTGSGYSTPTIAEVRASDNVVNSSLQAETGNNMEVGIKYSGRDSRLACEISAFYFILDEAIVRRTDSSGNEYFINAGGTLQKGLEAQVSIHIIKEKTRGIIRSADVHSYITHYNFTFREYSINGADFSGNPLTGVPAVTALASTDIGFAGNFNLFIQYYRAADIPLNDANTVKAGAYDLVQLKAQWKHVFQKKELIVFAGIDNLLDRTYSLGNDLNAAGARYYNAAAPRNYYAGVKFRLY